MGSPSALRALALGALGAASAAWLSACCCGGCAQQPLDESGGELAPYEQARLPYAAPTTHAEHRAAAPTWVRPEERAAPALTGAAGLFAAQETQPPVDALERGLLLCQVSLKEIADAEPLDNAHPAELNVTMALGDVSELTALGPEDTPSPVFALPAVTLKAGDPLHIQVSERDPDTLTPLGDAKGEFQGLPLTLESERFSVVCRTVKAAQVKRQLNRFHWQFVPLQKKSPATFTATVAGDEPDLGLAETTLPELRQLTLSMAALVGWADPRVKEHAETYRRLEQLWHRGANRALADVAQKSAASAVLGDGSLRLEVQALRCGAGAEALLQASARAAAAPALNDGACALSLKVTNEGMRPMPISQDPRRPGIGAVTSLALVAHSEEALALARLHPETLKGDTLDTGQDITMTLLSDSPSGTRRAHNPLPAPLLRVQGRGALQWLKAPPSPQGQ